MKTIKFAAALLLILGLTTISVSGQNKPVTIVAQAEITNGELYFDCLDQFLFGTLTATRTFMNNHVVAKLSGTLTGSADNLEYSVELINSKDIDWPNWEDWGIKTLTFTWVQNLRVLREGKLIGIMGFAYHFTVNPNGEVTSDHGGEVYRVTCVGGK